MNRLCIILVAALVIPCAQLFASPIVLDSSFELPSLGAGGYQEGTPPTDWTKITAPLTPSSFGGGIVANGSAYHNPNAPDGTQALLLKGGGGAEQMLSGFLSGYTYEVIFDAAPRTDCCGPNTFEVLIGGTPLTFTGQPGVTLGTDITPPNTGGYTLYTSAPFTATSTTPTLEFLSNVGNNDLSAFVDKVMIIPEPGSLVLFGLGALGLFVAARLRRHRWLRAA